MFLWCFRVCFLPCCIECLPNTLDSHGHAVLLWLYRQYLSEDKGCTYPGLLISGGCRCCGTLGFFLYRSWYFYQLSQLHLWWLVWPPLSCSIFFGTQAGDLCTYSSSLWSSSGCCSHLVWLHLWWHTCWSPSLVLIGLAYCMGCVYLWLLLLFLLFKKKLEEITSFHGATDTHFGLLVTLGFKVRVDSFLHAFLPVQSSNSPLVWHLLNA